MSRRLAVVTGASSGIGAATAVRLAKEGWQVVAAARREDRLAELAAKHEGIRPLVLDVTDPACAAVLAEHGAGCQLLVANAGGAFDFATLADADLQDWARMYDLNVLGLARSVQALLPALRETGGHVIMLGSTAGRWVSEGGGGYVAAKHAVAALRSTLRLEEVENGLRVTEVAPGIVRTEEFNLIRFQGDVERAGAAYEGLEPLTAEDVAEAIVWCASLPKHVNVDLLHLTPQQQAAVHKVVRHQG